VESLQFIQFIMPSIQIEGKLPLLGKTVMQMVRFDVCFITQMSPLGIMSKEV